ncbi:MAG: signal peptidase I [Cellvibrionales bacterium]|nr:signal peptidase I [Cellvibrionales bacterium]
MNFDFSLLLFIALVATGGLWLLDKLLLKPRRQPPRKPSLAVEYAASFFPVLLIVFIIRSFLYEPFQIPSKSMLPTLQVGDFILVDKFSYGLRLPLTGTQIIPIGQPQRGDLMVFTPPGDNRYFIKRVIGLPGDQIRLRAHQIWVNGEPQPREQLETLTWRLAYSTELWQETTGETTHATQVRNPPGLWSRSGDYQVPPGHYFMLGDNRDNSSDSRTWGPVPESNIVGKAVAIWMHWKDWGLPSFSRAGKIE